MSLKLDKIVQFTEYHDPARNFEPVRIPSEVRYDPFTGEGVRVFSLLKSQMKKYDWEPTVKLSEEGFCPFCPESLEKSTPRFPDRIVPGGRLKIGDAVVIPNMFPCEPYSGVVVVSPEHYLPMAKIPAYSLNNALKAGFLFLRLVQGYDSTLTVSLNWNYMPHAGGSIIHPHLHAMAGAHPSNYQRALMKSCKRYYDNFGKNLIREFLKTEIETGERYLGRTGSIHWLASFAPRGIADVTAVFEERTVLDDVTDNDLESFADGVGRILAFYDRMNLSGFNAAVFPGRSDSEGYWITARLVGRFVMHPYGGSDMTQYQVLHGVGWSFISPEDIARQFVQLFENRG